LDFAAGRRVLDRVQSASRGKEGGSAHHARGRYASIAYARTSISSASVPVRGTSPSEVTSMVCERQTPYRPATRSDMGRGKTMPASSGAELSVRMKKPRKPTCGQRTDASGPPADRNRRALSPLPAYRQRKVWRRDVHPLDHLWPGPEALLRVRSQLHP